MAKLPDLDPSNLGFVAYWNAFDNLSIGEEDFEAEAPASAGIVAESALYDNGIQGKLETGWSRGPLNFRVKTDGWFIVWTAQNAAYSHAEDCYANFIEVDTSDENTSLGDFRINTLDRSINLLAAELTNWDSIYSDEFSKDQIGLYAYGFPNSTATTVIGNGSPDNFTVTESTDLMYGAAIGKAGVYADQYETGTMTLKFEGTEFAKASANNYSAGVDVGIKDMYDMANIQPGNTYAFSSNANSGAYSSYDSYTPLFIWGEL